MNAWGIFEKKNNILRAVFLVTTETEAWMMFTGSAEPKKVSDAKKTYYARQVNVTY